MHSQTGANRAAWNAIAGAHAQSYHIERLLDRQPLINDVIRSEVGDVRGKSLMHLLCHIGTDTLSWALLGAQVSGVDISEQAIGVARSLAGQLGIAADFIHADIMEYLEQAKPEYDIVFSSTGVLCWLPDIERYAATVRRLLKPGGFFYILDGHPFRKMFERQPNGDLLMKNDYFDRSALTNPSFTDYAEANLDVPIANYEWQWTMGDVVSALCKQGLRIEFLHEYAEYFYNGYTPFDVPEHAQEIYPCTFSIKAVAP